MHADKVPTVDMDDFYNGYGENLKWRKVLGAFGRVRT